MSKLRPTLVDTTKPGLEYPATYFRVLQAVNRRRGLLHGKLKNGHGRACAIGCYFSESDVPIDTLAIDEIAAFNDSFPKLSDHQRWLKVVAWLRFQVNRMAKP